MADKLSENKRDIVIGYGGYAKISGSSISTYLHVTNANFGLQFQRPTHNCIFAPVPYEISVNSANFNDASVSQIILDVGTAIINGSISFDLSKDNIDKLISGNFLCRGNTFGLELYDGRIGYQIQDCSWTSVSFAASPGGLVQGQISFVALNDNKTIIKKVNQKTSSDYIFKDQLIAYWQAGAQNIQSFSVNFSLQVQPVYLNNGFIMPTYFRYGNLGIKMDISSFLDWEGLTSTSSLIDSNKFTLKIAEKSIKINNKITEVQQFTQNGINDVGMHNYSIFGYLPNGTSPYEKLFEIE